MKRIICREEDTVRGPLVLVNRSHPLQAKGPIPLAPACTAHPSVLMERKAALLLEACLRSVGGRQKIIPVSGWRSHAEQQEIWDSSWEESGAEFTRRYVALPGCSEHQTGLAIDLGKAAGKIDFIRPAFPYDGVCGAFRRAAARYGFIERYEKGREDVTGISHEPWHFRYVGAPHARLLQENGLCLEEYSAFLREGPQSCALADGRIAQVFYVPCAGEETVIEIPGDCYQVSGDNDGGFIVTVWGRAV